MLWSNSTFPNPLFDLRHFQVVLMFQLTSLGNFWKQRQFPLLFTQVLEASTSKLCHINRPCFTFPQHILDQGFFNSILYISQLYFLSLGEKWTEKEKRNIQPNSSETPGGGLGSAVQKNYPQHSRSLVNLMRKVCMSPPS